MYIYGQHSVSNDRAACSYRCVCVCVCRELDVSLSNSQLGQVNWLNCRWLILRPSETFSLPSLSLLNSPNGNIVDFKCWPFYHLHHCFLFTPFYFQRHRKDALFKQTDRLTFGNTHTRDKRKGNYMYQIAWGMFWSGGLLKGDLVEEDRKGWSLTFWADLISKRRRI